jgi:hypothetical protein
MDALAVPQLVGEVESPGEPVAMAVPETPALTLRSPVALLLALPQPLSRPLRDGGAEALGEGDREGDGAGEREGFGEEVSREEVEGEGEGDALGEATPVCEGEFKDVGDARADGLSAVRKEGVGAEEPLRSSGDAVERPALEVACEEGDKALLVVGGTDSVPRTECVSGAVGAADAEGLLDVDDAREGATEALALPLERVLSVAAETLPVAEGAGESVVVGDPEAVPLGEGAPLIDASEAVARAVNDAAPAPLLPLATAEGVNFPEPLPRATAVAVGGGDAESVPQTEGDAHSLPLAEGHNETRTLRLAESDARGVVEARAEADTEGVGGEVHDGVVVPKREPLARGEREVRAFVPVGGMDVVGGADGEFDAVGVGDEVSERTEENDGAIEGAGGAVGGAVDVAPPLPLAVFVPRAAVAERVLLVEPEEEGEGEDAGEREGEREVIEDAEKEEEGLALRLRAPLVDGDVERESAP